MVSLVVLLACATNAWALPADETLPVYTAAEGVSAVRAGGEWTVRFAPAADEVYRRVRGRMTRTSCIRVGGTALGSERLAPRARSTLRSGVRTAADLCTVATVRGSDDDACYDGVDDPAWCPRVIVATSEQGQAYLADARLRVDVLFVFLGATAPARPFSLGALSRRYPGEVAALAAPDALPPQGKLGYWTAGAQVTVAMLRPDGRRYFMSRLAVDGDVVTSTNLPGVVAAAFPPVL